MLDLGDITFRRLRCWWLGIESTLNLQLGARFWRVCFVIRGHMLYVSRRRLLIIMVNSINIVLVWIIFEVVAKFWANSFSLRLRNSYISMWTGVDTIWYRAKLCTNRLCELLFLSELFLRRSATDTRSLRYKVDVHRRATYQPPTLPRCPGLHHH